MNKKHPTSYNEETGGKYHFILKWYNKHACVLSNKARKFGGITDYKKYYFSTK